MTDTVVINSAPTSGAPDGHDQKMIDLVDKSAEIPTENLDLPADNATNPEDRPQWLPEKFKTPEEMAKAYSELESKIGKPADDKPAGDIPDAANANPDEANKALADRGLDFTEFSNEFTKTGELSAESYEKLEKSGLPKDLVDQYIEGQKARASQFESSIKGEVGGDERFGQIVEWAKGSLTASEIAAFNTAVSSGDVEQARLAVLGLSTRYSNANGSDPKRFVGGGKASGEDKFESTTQITEAMRDPRYKTDPAYRAQVTAKLSRSSVI